MTISENLFRKWIHSFEEDMDDITVYRPENYNFPRSRGRKGIEFFSDGKVIFWNIGRDDRSVRINGYWKRSNMDIISVLKDDNTTLQNRFQLIHCDNNILKLRKLDIS